MAVFTDEKSYTSVSTCQIREDTGSVRTPQWCSAVAGLSSIRRTVSMKSVPFLLAVLLLVSTQLVAQAQRLEQLQNRTILVFTPHPDDDVFGAGGTIALLNRNHNRVHVVVYTNDDKGSYDENMTSQRLALIRKAEQEASEGLLGTPKENISWMGMTTACWSTRRSPS
jgi:GlcNAc-PI de-N-acetylase